MSKHLDFIKKKNRCSLTIFLFKSTIFSMTITDVDRMILKNLSRSFLPVLFLIGNLSCFLSILLLLRKSMRKNGSGIYFLAFTFSNWIFINVIVLDTILFFGFDVDPTANNLRLCQFHIYIGFVTNAFSTTFLVLASADRYVITSSNDSIRRFSRRTMAKKLVVIVTIFWSIVHLHPFFLFVRSESPCEQFSCSTQSQIYALIIVLYELIVLGLISPCLWIIFAVRTIVNVRRVLVHPLSRLYAIDRQLILIMLSQCSLFVLFRLPLPISLIYAYFTHRSIETIRLYITLICFYVPFCTFFFVNLISKSFRDEFRRCAKKTKKQRKIRVYPLQIVRQN